MSSFGSIGLLVVSLSTHKGRAGITLSGEPGGTVPGAGREIGERRAGREVLDSCAGKVGGCAGAGARVISAINSVCFTLVCFIQRMEENLYHALALSGARIGISVLTIHFVRDWRKIEDEKRV